MKNNLIVGAILLACGLVPPSTVEARTKTKIALMAGTQGHGLGSHEWNAAAALIEEYLEAAYPDVDCVPYFHRQWPGDMNELADAAAIVVIDSGGGGHPVARRLKEFAPLMEKGIGFACLHYAVEVPKGDAGDAFKNWLGGHFETFWSVNPHWTAEFKSFPNHPVLRGVKPFAIEDEWYFHMRFRDGMKGVTPILSAVAPRETMRRGDGPHSGNPAVRDAVAKGEAQHVAWVSERENGARGFGFTGMHLNANWAHDDFRKVILNGIAWTAKLEIPNGGVSSGAKSREALHDLARKFEGGFGKAGVKATAVSARTEAKPIFQSQTLDTSAKSRFVEIDLPLKEKTRKLYLAVSEEGSLSCDWADWIDPRVVLTDGTEVSLTTLQWKPIVTGYGRTQLNKNQAGREMLVDGKVIERGVGTHAPSVVEFDLPAGAARFLSRGAIDDGGMVRNGKPSNAEIRFLVYSEKPKALPKSNSAGKSAFFDPDSREPQRVPVDAFSHPDDLEVTVWATSPMLFNPTNMDTDEAGRIWVTEGVNYRRHQNRRKEGDRVVVLQDTDGDGRADHSHTFVQDPELIAPLGIAVMGNRIVVSQPPHLIVYTDVDGDLKFDPKKDRRENLLTGFFGNNHDHSLHAVVAGPDGKWYFNQGNTGADFTTRDGVHYRVGGPYADGGKIAGALSDDGRVWTGGFAARMNPDGTGLTMIGHGFRNSYEHCVTSFGDVYQNDNDDPPACRTTWLMEGGFLGFFSRDGRRSWRADRRAGQTTAVAEWRQEDPGTLPPGDVYGAGSPTGIAFYEHGALPAKYDGLLLSAEARGQVIFGYYPKADGAGKKLERFDFLKATSGNLFRPSDVMVGADGAIYVADWFDPGVGGHADRDESLSGTIYRVAPKGFKPLLPATPDQPSARLLSPAPNVRYRGWETLKAAGPGARREARLLLSNPNPRIAARAVWLLPFMGEEGLKECRARLKHKDSAQRLLAFRALRNAGQPVLDLAAALEEERSPDVLREVAVSLRNEAPARKAARVADLFLHYDGKDRVYLEACGLAAEGVEQGVWTRLRWVLKAESTMRWSEAFARITWRLQPVEALPALVQRARSAQLSWQERKLATDTIAFVRSPKAVEAMAELLREAGPVKSLATAWMLNRAGGEWRDFGVMPLLKRHGIYDPDRVEIQEITVAEAPKSRLPSAREIAKLKGDPALGRQIATACTTCHLIDGLGVDYGPELRGWVASQSVEAFIDAVLNPSGSIAHGYDGEIVKLKDGREVHGLIYSQGDPLMIRSTGGVSQLIPAKMIAGKTKELRRSLMLSAEQLGLNAQLVADLAAFFSDYR
jgi:putative membrane-bound dehydrogenase-like protein